MINFMTEEEEGLPVKLTIFPNLEDPFVMNIQLCNHILIDKIVVGGVLYL